MTPPLVFVFGSNLAGKHGKGAALAAARHYGAERGVGEGRAGQSYAIPTKDENLRTRNVADIEKSVSTFCAYAKAHPDEIFLLTPVGTGLAGLPKRTVWAMLMRCGLPPNVVLASTWVTPAAPQEPTG